MITSYNNILQDRWESVIGRKYCCLFKKLNLEKNSIVVEIGPGMIGSIGKGLCQFNYTGTLYIIEPEPDSLDKVQCKYKTLLPRAKVVGVNKRLSEVLNSGFFKNVNMDLVVGNHILDDYIIGKSFESPVEFTDFFTDHYTEYNIEAISNRWKNLINNRLLLKRIVQETIAEFRMVISLSNSAIFSSYNSHFFTVYKKKYPYLRYPDRLAQLVLRRLNNDKVGLTLKNRECIINEENWICLKKRKD